MLKKPYLKLHSIENNNYYILKSDDTIFLTIETVIKYGRKNRKELTVAIKQFPLSSFNVQIFMRTLLLKDTVDREVDGLEDEPNFEELDIKTIRSDMHKLTMNLNSPVLFTRFTTNTALKSFMDEGNKAYCVVDNGKYSRTHWLARTDKFGCLRMYEVLMYGKPSTEKVIDMNMYVFDRETMEKVLDFITKNIKLENENKKESV